MMRRFLPLLLVMLMVLTACSKEEGTQQGTTGEEQDVQTEQTTGTDDSSVTDDDAMAEDGRTLKILTNVVGGKNPEEHELFVAAIEEALGVDVEMTKPASDYDNVLLQKLGSGEKYDIIYTVSGKIPLLVEQGALMDMTQLIADSPVLSDEQVIPSSEYDLFRMDGKLYGTPSKYEGGRLAIVREDWLREFGIDAPVTLEDWENYWKLCKEEKGAWGIATAGLYDIQPWASAWGLKDAMVLDEGKLTVPYANDEAAAMWDWLNEMYEKGYFEPNYETNGTGEVRSLIFGDMNGTMAYWDAWVGLFNAQESERYEAGTFEMKGYAGVPSEDGEIILTRGDSSLWAIPANAENVDLAVKFLEFWNSEKGYLLGTIGIEGHDYTVSGAEYTLTDIGTEHNMDHGSPRVQSKTWEHPFPPLPGVSEAEVVINAYATPLYQPAQWDDAKKIVEYWGFKAIKGEVSGEEAVSGMQQELKDGGLID